MFGLEGEVMSLSCESKGVFIWRRASPLCRDSASQLNSLSKIIFVYERRASPPW